MGKKKIILDTNILISALGWKGNPRIIFNKITEKKFELILPYKQLNELLRVLNYPKFKVTNEQKDRFLAILLEISTLVKTKTRVNAIKDDPDDNIILEPANEMKIDYIISGDEHLLKVKEFKSAKIVTAKEFLDKIKK